MRVWTVDEMPEQFDAMLDDAEADGPQLIQYGDKTMIVTTRADYEDHLAGKRSKFDDLPAAASQS